MARSLVTVAATIAAVLIVPNCAIAAPVKLNATLTGANEVSGGDTDAVGGFTAELDPETNDFCYTLWIEKASKVTMSHLHVGKAGEDGSPVLALDITGKNSDLCIAVDKDKLEPIAANPGGHYINVHTADFPKGAVRGQLVK